MNDKMIANPVFDASRLESLKSALADARSVVITNHKNPDGDAMGSALGLYHFLQHWDLRVRVIVPNTYPAFLKWLPGDDQVLIYEGNTDEANEWIANADVIFALDYNELDRTGELETPLREAMGTKVLIDHHQNPGDFADISFSDVTSCATAQLVFELAESLGMTDRISVEAGTCLYTGLVTDTGSFRYPATTSKTHQIAAELLKIGVKNGEVHRSLFDNNSEMVLKMRGHVLSNNLVVLPDYKTAFISITRKEQEEYDTKPGDTEGLVNEALSIKGVVMAAFFKEDYKLVKISFRSLGTFPVNELASKHFGGGGHRNAAGGSSKDSLEATMKRFQDILPEYKTQLDDTK